MQEYFTKFTTIFEFLGFVNLACRFSHEPNHISWVDTSEFRIA